jgi:hypothetical protein
MTEFVMNPEVIYPENIDLKKHQEELAKKIDEAMNKAKDNKEKNTNTTTVNVNVVNGVSDIANKIEGLGDNLDKFADLLREGVAKAEGKKVSKYQKAPKYTFEGMQQMLIEAVNNGETSVLLDSDKIKAEDYAKFKMNPNFHIGEYQSPKTCCGGFMGKLIDIGQIELSFNFTPKLI